MKNRKYMAHNTIYHMEKELSPLVLTARAILVTVIGAALLVEFLLLFGR